MPGDLPPVPQAALALWRELAGDPRVGAPGTRKVVRGSRGLGPPGWTAVLRLGDAWAIEAGDADEATLAALLDLDDPADPDQVAAVVRPADTLGPGELAYLPETSGAGPRPGRGHDVPAHAPEAAEAAEAVEAERANADVVEVAGNTLSGWIATLPPADVEESGVGAMSTLLVADVDGQHVAAAGHVTWPTDIAHIGIVVAPEARGQGYGQVLGAAATRRAVAHGLVPQWRAAMTNPASRALAARIGFVEVGRQYSFRVEPDPGV